MVQRSPNHLYIHHFVAAEPSRHAHAPSPQSGDVLSLATRKDEQAWLWHERYGHLHFDALHKLCKEDMVLGMPVIKRDGHLYDTCVVTKQRRAPFPAQAKYRAQKQLELVHGDLCGPITSEMPSGNKYFLLLVDDRSRFMWLTSLPSKDRAAAAIKEFQARTEGESGLKLGALRTDRGGEFTSIEFAEHCTVEGV